MCVCVCVYSLSLNAARACEETAAAMKFFQLRRGLIDSSAAISDISGARLAFRDIETRRSHFGGSLLLRCKRLRTRGTEIAAPLV